MSDSFEVSSAALEDARLVLGAAPHDNEGNLLKADSQFYTDCRQRHGFAVWAAALAMVRAEAGL